MEDEDALEDADLRRREPEPVRVLQQLLHSLHQPAQVPVEVLDLVRPHPQSGVGVLADLGERDQAPRFRLGVQLVA